MIGAPSDIKEEVKIAIDVIQKWNYVNSDKEEVILQPLHWSISTYPEVGRPQGTINKQMVEKSDMLISIFGTRIGSPTGLEKSGTIEEINEHIKANKTVMVFFKTSGSYKGLDPKQIQSLQDYQEEIKDKVRWEEFETSSDFKELLTEKLQLFLNATWLKETQEEAYHDDNIIKDAERTLGQVPSFVQFNNYVFALDELFENVEQLLTCHDAIKAKYTLDSVVSLIHAIYDKRNREGKCRVTTGKKDLYIGLMEKVNHEKSDEIIRYLNSAIEVPKDFQEMDDIFQ